MEPSIEGLVAILFNSDFIVDVDHIASGAMFLIFTSGMVLFETVPLDFFLNQEENPFKECRLL